jgi:hypothetical protein
MGNDEGASYGVIDDHVVEPEKTGIYRRTVLYLEKSDWLGRCAPEPDDINISHDSLTFRGTDSRQRFQATIAKQAPLPGEPPVGYPNIIALAFPNISELSLYLGVDASDLRIRHGRNLVD